MRIMAFMYVCMRIIVCEDNDVWGVDNGVCVCVRVIACVHTDNGVCVSGLWCVCV